MSLRLMERGAQKIFLAFLGALFSLVLLEAGMRLAGFLYLARQDHGNRTSARQAGAYRILCIGESTTAGQYPPYLAAILNKGEAGIKFAVIDKGIPGINTSGILHQLGSDLDTYKPHMVVAMIGINDASFYIPSVSPEAPRLSRFWGSLRVVKMFRLLGEHLKAKIRQKQERLQDGGHPVLSRLSAQMLTCPNDARCAQQGNFFLSQEHHGSAEEAFRRSLDLNPGNEAALLGMGYNHMRQLQYAQAEDYFLRAVESHPGSGSVYTGLGWVYLHEGRYPRSEEAFRKAVDLDPELPQAHVGLGWAYGNQFRYQEAEAAFQKAIALTPKDAAAYIALGIFYSNNHKYPEAEGAFKKALQIDPSSADIHARLGSTCWAEKKLGEAEAAFRKAAALDPLDERAYIALAALARENKEFKLAQSYEGKLRELRSDYHNPVTSRNYRQLKRVLEERGIKLVCVQYPMRGIGPLKKMLEGEGGVLFVDNEQAFKDAVRKEGRGAYFADMFAGDFGHCTDKGNRLLAKNIADVILKEHFHR